jgi:rRNA maturation endonuclease Nob1
MNRFYLKKLIVSGKGHEDSTIDFTPGLNFILGPSNTGKSFIMESIDYVFGFTPKPNKRSKVVDNSNGYENITLILSTSNGDITLKRTIGESKIYVSGANLTSGFYSTSNKAKKNISSIYLQLLGINEEHKIRSAITGDSTQMLTWRSILHLFFIKQADVTRETSAFISPSSVGETASLAALLFLLTGQDASNVCSIEERKIREGKRQALISYLSDKVNYTASRRAEIESELAYASNSNTNLTIEQIRQHITKLQSMINAATQESNELMTEIYELNGKLSEARTVKHNFTNLRIQYQTDIKRIGFIVDCAAAGNHDTPKTICPICGSETETLNDPDIVESSAAELQKIKQRLLELGTAQETIDSQEDELTNTIKRLEEKRNSIDKMISEQLQPQLSEFQNQLEKSIKFIRLSGELDVVRETESELRNELFEKEVQEIPKDTEYHIKEDFPSQLVKGYEEILRYILKESKFGGAEKARLNMEIFDIQIDKLPKAVFSGGGICGILNAISTIAMSQYLIELDRYAPGFYAVDSSLTQLSEGDAKKPNETVKHNFINYLLKHANERQIIFVEQTKRMPFIPETNIQAGVNTTIFTHDKNNGRYGFLNDVYNPEDQ